MSISPASGPPSLHPVPALPPCGSPARSRGRPHPGRRLSASRDRGCETSVTSSSPGGSPLDRPPPSVPGARPLDRLRRPAGPESRRRPSQRTTRQPPRDAWARPRGPVSHRGRKAICRPRTRFALDPDFASAQSSPCSGDATHSHRVRNASSLGPGRSQSPGGRTVTRRASVQATPCPSSAELCCERTRTSPAGLPTAAAADVSRSIASRDPRNGSTPILGRRTSA